MDESNSNQPQNANPSTDVLSKDVSKPLNSQEPITPTLSGNNIGSSNIVVEKSKKSVIDVLIFISLIIAFFIWSGVFYLYIQNKNISKQASVTTPTATSYITPTITQKLFNIITKNGNIINISENNEEIIVDKNDYKSTGITGFTKVSTSPDKDKICFESWPPSIEPAMYISDINGENVEEISKFKKDCTWSHSGKMVAYDNLTTTKAKVTDIFYYDLESKIEKNLTANLASTESAKLYNYKVISWSDDDNNILCEFSPISKSSDTKNCEIIISSNTFNEI